MYLCEFAVVKNLYVLRYYFNLSFMFIGKTQLKKNYYNDCCILLLGLFNCIAYHIKIIIITQTT